jgi:hypothetical protein
MSSGFVNERRSCWSVFLLVTRWVLCFLSVSSFVSGSNEFQSRKNVIVLKKERIMFEMYCLGIVFMVNFFSFLSLLSFENVLFRIVYSLTFGISNL